MSKSEATSALKPAQFGGRIRDLRRKAQLTLQELADRAGISVGFLSLVERDKATPSLGTLASLAAALGVEVEVFIATPRPSESVTRQGERIPFALNDTSLRYEQLSTTLAGGTLTSLIITIPKDYKSEVVSHVGEELILVLSGTIRQTLGTSEFIMNEGDSMHFMGDTPHSFSNIGDGEAKLLWTGTSPHVLNSKLKTKQTIREDTSET